MTLTEFKDWAVSQGSVAKYDDGQFPGQCVSLINQYCYRVLNIPAGAWGNAKDWATSPQVAQYFDKVSSINQGDVIVYGPNYGSGDGHIGIWYDGQLLDQNFNNDGKVKLHTAPTDYIAVLRPKKGEDMVDRDTMDKLYYMTLGRGPKQDELDYWVGRSTNELISSVAGRDERKAYADKVEAALAGGSFQKVDEPLYRKDV